MASLRCWASSEASALWWTKPAAAHTSHLDFHHCKSASKEINRIGRPCREHGCTGMPSEPSVALATRGRAQRAYQSLIGHQSSILRGRSGVQRLILHG
ncbi:hypothetical protein BJX70DRAFT_134745 [Aspergillus crustosus]